MTSSRFSPSAIGDPCVRDRLTDVGDVFLHGGRETWILARAGANAFDVVLRNLGVDPLTVAGPV